MTKLRANSLDYYRCLNVPVSALLAIAFVLVSFALPCIADDSTPAELGLIETAGYSHEPTSSHDILHGTATHCPSSFYDDGLVLFGPGARYPGAESFSLKLNAWGQLRHTFLGSTSNQRDMNQLQLKRGRLVFSGHAYKPEFTYFFQMDGRSAAGDSTRLLDYYLRYDFGKAHLGMEKQKLGLLLGRYKLPSTLARRLSGRELEFTDRSVSSIFFDVNRSMAFGLYGTIDQLPRPLIWEVALFNGIGSGGATTGINGAIDNNLGISGRFQSDQLGEWREGSLVDFTMHEEIATRVGCGFAFSKIDRSGLAEFNRVRVVDSGQQLSSIVPNAVNQYSLALFSVDASAKYRGWSATIEYYFRSIGGFRGADVNNLFDHGLWLQLGNFLVEDKLQVLTRWSRVQGNSGTLGISEQSTEEISGAVAWYFKRQSAKLVSDLTYLNGSPVEASVLDIRAGQSGWLWRTQYQFAF